MQNPWIGNTNCLEQRIENACSRRDSKGQKTRKSPTFIHHSMGVGGSEWRQNMELKEEMKVKRFCRIGKKGKSNEKR